MSQRRHYLVSYDISDDKRRNQVFRYLHGQGDHAQFSVFFCEWNRREVADARQNLRSMIHQGEDQILILDLGSNPRSLETCLEVLGKPFTGNTRVLVI